MKYPAGRFEGLPSSTTLEDFSRLNKIEHYRPRGSSIFESLFSAQKRDSVSEESDGCLQYIRLRTANSDGDGFVLNPNNLDYGRLQLYPNIVHS